MRNQVVFKVQLSFHCVSLTYSLLYVLEKEATGTVCFVCAFVFVSTGGSAYL